MKKTIQIRIIIICTLAVLAIVTILLMASANRKKIKESNSRVSHTQEVLLSSEQIISALKDIEVGTRGYLLTSDSGFLQPYNLSNGSVVESIEKLRILTADDIPKQQRVDSVHRLALERINISKISIAQYEKEKIISESTVRLIKKGKGVMDSIRAVVSRIQQNENNLLHTRKLIAARQEKSSDILFYILFASLAIFFAVVFFSIWYGLYQKKNGKWFYLAARTNIFDGKIEAILNGVSDPFFALDNRGLFTFINKAAKNKLGLSRTGNAGKNIFDEFPLYQNSKTGTEIKNALKTKQPQSFETFDDLLEQWEDVTIYPVEDGITVFIKDATQRKNIEKKFLRTQQFLEETSQVAKVGGWEMDVLKSTIYWSSVTREIHETAANFSPELSEGINFYKAGESRDIIQDSVTNAMEHGTGWDLELQIVTAKGNEKWVRTIGKTDIVDGQCVRMYATFQDITERRKAEQDTLMLASIVEYSGDAMILTDTEGIILTWNKAAENNFEYAAGEIIGKPFYKLMPDSNRQQELDIQHTIKKGETITQLDTIRITKHGKLINVSTTVSPIKNSRGNIIGMSRISRNITERKKMEQAHEKITQRLAIATSAAGIGIWEYNILNNSLQWDENMYQLYDINPDNFKGAYEAWEESLHPDDKARGSEDIQLAIEGKKEFNTEFRILTKDKSVKYIQARATVTKDAHGKPLQMIGTNWDITEKVIAAEQLRISEENFRGAFEYAAIGIALVGVKGEWLKVNRSLCSMVGYTRDELMKLTFQDITHPEDLNTDLELLDKLVTGKIDNYQLEKRYYDKNRNIVWVMLAVSMVADHEKKPLYFVSQITNITAEKEARQKVQEVLSQLKSVLDASTQVSIIGTTVDGIINIFNKGAENLLGYTAEEIIGKHNPSIIHVSTEIDKRGEELSAIFNREIKGFDVFTQYAKEGKYDSREWTYIRKDGSSFPVQLVVMPVKSGEVITGFLGIALDISRIKEVESIMENKNRELALANDELEQFAFIASHDLQEPLRTITGFISLLEKKYFQHLDDKGKEYFDFITQGAKRMKNIINDILDYSRTGNMMSQPERVNLNDLVKFIADEIKTNQNNSIIPVIEWNNLPLLLADKTAMHQLFSNLISNGVKYQAPGNIPVVKISVEDSGKYWLFRIQDNGIGIEPKYFEKVFEIFQRLHGKAEYAGTGIGLAISKKIVTYHKGEIWIESTVGAGSTFCFTIPKK